MPAILAQQLPVTELTASVINIIVGLLAVSFLVKNLLKKDTPLVQPLRTQREIEYVPRHEFTQLQDAVRLLSCRVETSHNDVLRAGEDRAIKLHERLNLLLTGLSEVQGRTEVLTHHFLERDPVTRKMRVRK
jgi:hypothetical protein